MSEFYQSTPATRLFTGDSVVLSGEQVRAEETLNWTSTQVILWISYCIEDKGISIGIYDDVEREYRLQKMVEDYATAKEVMEQIAADYPKKVKLKNYLPTMEVFFKAAPEIVGYFGDVDDTFASCGQCGDWNENKFNFLYVPAVPGTVLDESSLGLHWKFGCYGGEEVSGTFEGTEESVRGILNNMLESADADCKEGIQEVIDTFNALSVLHASTSEESNDV